MSIEDFFKNLMQKNFPQEGPRTRKCCRCEKVIGNIPMQHHINGLCLKCNKEKPRVSPPAGKYSYYNPVRRQTEHFTITEGWESKA